MKILLVEDEPALKCVIQQYLEEEGFIVATADTYPQAAEKVNDYDYDCVVIDLMLPGGHGFDLVRTLKRRKSTAGVIVVTAKDSLTDKITGLEMGADDYLTKPFYLPELNARIRSVLRRRFFGGLDAITAGEIILWPNQQRVMVKNAELNLTGKEYEILLFLITNTNRLLSKSVLAEHIWGDAMDQVDSHEFLYSHMKNLRRKLMVAGCPDYIQTRYGAGYLFSTRMP